MRSVLFHLWWPSTHNTNLLPFSGLQVLTAIFLVVCDFIFISLLTFTSHRQRAAAKTGEILNSAYFHACLEGFSLSFFSFSPFLVSGWAGITIMSHDTKQKVFKWLLSFTFEIFNRLVSRLPAIGQIILSFHRGRVTATSFCNLRLEGWTAVKIWWFWWCGLLPND